ncbi:extracellular solute-binding protein [Muricoccus aerilatus]|uniref:extracellular solute-binding protein n=1 Tax=Muricoccus aerilatus TaxID=452982 RepID=UPI001FDEA94E|nr:extracellular solute-binding protein [Roseomonas aerilata]
MRALAPTLPLMRRRTLLATGLAAGLPALPALAQGAPPVAGPRRVHALSLLGEPALPADFTHFPWVNPEAPKGGEVAQTALGSFDSLHPFILRGTAATGLGRLYDTLLVGASDEANTAYGHLAGAIELPADNRSVTFELREGARWHDGRPITAEDVAWTFRTLIEKGHPRYRNYYGDVAGAEAEGERRVTFRFRTDGNRELAQILGQFPILPKHWWEGRDFAQPSLEIPLGSGAYRLERFEAGRSVVFRRVPDYWGRDLPTMRGTRNVDVVRYEYFRDATVAFEAFKAGGVDFRQENIARSWATLYDFPAVQRGQVKRDELKHELPAGMQGFIMNLRRPIFADARTREAMALAFDFEWMNKNLFYDSYARTTSYFANSDFASRGLPEGRELAILEGFRDKLPARLFTEPFRVPVTDGSGNNRENTRRALELLREAGWTIRDRRMVNAGGQPLTFEILLSDATFERLALPYVQSLQRLGVEARVRTIDLAQYQVRVENFDYDMTLDSFGQSLHPGNEQRDYWSSAKADQPGSQNTIGIKDPVVDALVELVVAAPDGPELIARTRALDRVLLWGQYVVPHYHSRVFRIAWWDRFGRPTRNPRYDIGFEAWWIDPARDAALASARRSPA